MYFVDNILVKPVSHSLRKKMLEKMVDFSPKCCQHNTIPEANNVLSYGPGHIIIKRNQLKSKMTSNVKIEKIRRNLKHP